MDIKFQKKYSSCSDLCDPSRRCYSINDQQQVFPGIHGRQWNMQRKDIPQKINQFTELPDTGSRKISNKIIDLAKLQYFSNPENPEIRGCRDVPFVATFDQIDTWIPSIRGIPKFMGRCHIFDTPKKRRFGQLLEGETQLQLPWRSYGVVNMQYPFLCHQSTMGPDPEV